MFLIARNRRVAVALALVVLGTVGFTGCGARRGPKPEVRLAQTTPVEAEPVAPETTNTNTPVAQGQKSPRPGAWSPGGAPGEDSFADTTSVGRDSSSTTTAVPDPIPAATTEVADVKRDATGSVPNTASLSGVEGGQFTADLEMVHFEYDKFEIRPEWTKILDAHAEWLKANPAVMVQIEGHCDERGTEEYNIALGQRRADTVRQYLIDKGIDPNRLSTISYGKMRPLTFDANDEGHALNRRAMFLVYKQEAAGVASATQ